MLGFALCWLPAAIYVYILFFTDTIIWPNCGVPYCLCFQVNDSGKYFHKSLYLFNFQKKSLQWLSSDKLQFWPADKLMIPMHSNVKRFSRPKIRKTTSYLNSFTLWLNAESLQDGFKLFFGHWVCQHFKAIVLIWFFNFFNSFVSVRAEKVSSNVQKTGIQRWMEDGAVRGKLNITQTKTLRGLMKIKTKSNRKSSNFWF